MSSDSIIKVSEDAAGPNAPVGAVMSIPKNMVTPRGWKRWEDGLVPKEDYPELFAIIGTLYNRDNDPEDSFRLAPADD